MSEWVTYEMYAVVLGHAYANVGLWNSPIFTSRDIKEAHERAKECKAWYDQNDPRYDIVIRKVVSTVIEDKGDA